MRNNIYADNAATTQMDIEAFEAMKPFMLDDYGNASQPYSFSRVAKMALKKSRQTIAECINANPDEIYFTSGGTESDNWAIKGTAFNHPSKAIITSQIEHHAILRTCEFLETINYPVVYLPVTSEGVITSKILKENIADTASLVSIMFANNEIGTIQPIKELAEIAHHHGSLFHTDAVQAVGHIPVDVKKLGVDLLSASAHKFNGPKGIGFLFIKQGTKLFPYMHGGQQEQNLRGGTENVAYIVGMAVALKNNILELQKNQSHLIDLESVFFERLQQNDVLENRDYFRNGNFQKHICGNISISFKAIEGETMLHRLDLMGISVSTGAACDSVNTKISHVIAAIGIPLEIAKGTIRISFGKYNTNVDAIYVADCIAKAIGKLA